MKTRSRDVRSTRREVQAMKRGEQRFTRGDVDSPMDSLLSEDRPLPNGTQADPRQAWVLPSNEQPTKEN